jgi:uncharacterized membrane protein YfcA
MARLVVVLIAVAIAGLLRGFVGFGAALITVPVFSLVLGPHAAIAINSVMGLPAVLQLLPEAVRRAERPFVVPMCLATFIAAPIGTWALVVADPALMKVAISALVLLMVGFLASGWRLKGRIGMGKLMAAEVAGGLVQGVAGIGGPPVVAVALSRPGEASQQRANVLALMTAVALSSILPLLYHGLFTRQTVVIGLVLIPLYSAATALGAAISRSVATGIIAGELLPVPGTPGLGVMMGLEVADGTTRCGWCGSVGCRLRKPRVIWTCTRTCCASG